MSGLIGTMSDAMRQEPNHRDIALIAAQLAAQNQYRTPDQLVADAYRLWLASAALIQRAKVKHGQKVVWKISPHVGRN
jgi:hypothetical protein